MSTLLVSRANDHNRLVKAIAASALLHILLLSIKFHFSEPIQTRQDKAIPQPELRLHLLSPGSHGAATSKMANADQASPNNPRAAEKIFEVSLAASIPPPAPIPKISAKQPIAKSPDSLRKKHNRTNTKSEAKAQPHPQPPLKSLKLIAVEETKNETFSVPPPADGSSEASNTGIKVETKDIIQQANSDITELMPKDDVATQPLDATKPDIDKQTALDQARQEEIEEKSRQQAIQEAQHVAEELAQQKAAEQQAAEEQAARLRQEALDEEARKQVALTAKRLAEAQAEQQRIAEQQAVEAKAVQAAQAQAARLRQEALDEEARKQAALTAKQLAEAQAEQQRVAEQQAAEAKAAQARQQAAQEAKRLADLHASELTVRQARESATANAPVAGERARTQGNVRQAQDSNNRGPNIASVATDVGDAHKSSVTNSGAAGNASGQGSGKSSATGATQGTDAKSENKGIAVQTRSPLLDDSCSQKLAGRHLQVDLYATVWRHMVRLNAPYYLLDDAKTRPHINPIVTVAIRSDGNVENITFNRSSGRPEIDNAIWRMIHFLAPYTAFSKDLAIECEVIEFPSIWSINNGLNVTWGGQ